VDAAENEPDVKPIILGTAGHIDHGKTSLIRAMTGINTDRLKEEQLRGITIELGFAYLDLPSGRRLGIVDVPGHERFVKNMVAGATGIDLVLLVIAADEGVMPQTREHLEICMLLGVEHGLVALTKIDLVDEEWRELVMEDMAEFFQDTFLETAPVIPVSAATGEGIPALTAAVDDIAGKIPERTATGIFRLPVDRVFTMKGFGTVITGTVASGRVRTGDVVMLYPGGTTAKVRGLQVHNDSVGEARAGTRTAVNFQGLEKAAVHRGDVLSTPGALTPSYMTDVFLTYLKGNKKPLKNRARVRFHTGSSEVLGVVALLDSTEVSPGQSTVCQIRLDAPVAAVRDDRFVIRSYSPIRTIGGGFILNPLPPKHKRRQKTVAERLHRLTGGDPAEMIALHAKDAAHTGIDFARLRIMTNLPEKSLEQHIGALSSKRTLQLVDKETRLYIHGETATALQEQILEILGGYHTQNPLKPGMPREELKSRLPRDLDTKLFHLLITRLDKEGAIAVEEKILRRADHTVSLAGTQSEIKEKMEAAYRDGGLTPPYFRDVISDLGVDAKTARDVMNLLIDSGRVVKVKEELYFSAGALEELKRRLEAHLREHESITAPEFKELTGLTRKYLIPLLEYFDSIRFTIRIGDARKLRKG
jgi:selenocysteine-specific elongation factor